MSGSLVGFRLSTRFREIHRPQEKPRRIQETAVLAELTTGKVVELAVFLEGTQAGAIESLLEAWYGFEPTRPAPDEAAASRTVTPELDSTTEASERDTDRVSLERS